MQRLCHHVGRINQCFGSEQREGAIREHRLSAIDKRHRFFGFEHQRLDSSLPQRIGGRNARAVFIETLTFANQRESKMRERSKIAAGSNAALRRNKWGHAPIQQLANAVNDNGTHARMAFGKGISAKQHHCASLRNR